MHNTSSSEMPEALAYKVGAKTYTRCGFSDHGPMDPAEGPKVEIAADLHGVITHRTERFYMWLYFVKWSNGQTSGHYETSLLCLWPFETVDEARAAIATCTNLKITRGPQGGFKKIEGTLVREGVSYKLSADRGPWRELQTEFEAAEARLKR